VAKISDEKVQEIVRRRRAGGSIRQVAKELGIDRLTVAKYTAEYVPGGTVGEPPPKTPVNQVIDRTDVDGTVEMLRLDRPPTERELRAACHLGAEWVCMYFSPNTWQGMGKLKGPDGERFEKVQLYQSKATFKRVVDLDVQEAILEFARKNVGPIEKGALPLGRVERASGKPQVVSWGLWDAHLGAYAWRHEVGADWDVNIATRRIFNSIDDMVLELAGYPIKKIWMPVGNDFLHFDSVRKQTAYGEHHLDTDNRFAKVFMAGLECLAYMVERALELGAEIELIYVPGNHDTTSTYSLVVALAQRFLGDARVTADLRPIPRKYKMFGGTLLGFSHGEDAPAKKLNTIFSTETIKMFSRSTYREMQVGHKHQRDEWSFEGAIPTNGLLVRTNPCLCNVDKWHYDHGFIGEPVKSVEAWRYDEVGYRGSHVAWARDEENAKIGTLKLVNRAEEDL